MGEIIDFKLPQPEQPEYWVLRCPCCDGNLFHVLYSHGVPTSRCVACGTLFPSRPDRGNPE